MHIPAEVFYSSGYKNEAAKMTAHFYSPSRKELNYKCSNYAASVIITFESIPAINTESMVTDVNPEIT